MCEESELVREGCWEAHVRGDGRVHVQAYLMLGASPWVLQSVLGSTKSILDRLAVQQQKSPRSACRYVCVQPLSCCCGCLLGLQTAALCLVRPPVRFAALRAAVAHRAAAAAAAQAARGAAAGGRAHAGWAGGGWCCILCGRGRLCLLCICVPAQERETVFTRQFAQQVCTDRSK